MAQHRAHRGQALRSDDQVAPGLLRRRAPYIVALGIVGIVAGVVVLALYLNGGVQSAQQQAGLTQQDVADVRAYLADQRAQRKQETDRVDERLDAQTRALCAALGEVSKDASQSGYRALSRAGKRLDCDPLPRPTKKAPRPSSSPASSSGERAAGGTGSTSTSSRPREAPSAWSTPSPRASPRASTPPPPRAEPPAADPPPEPGPSRGPITGTVCSLVGLCL